MKQKDICHASKHCNTVTYKAIAIATRGVQEICDGSYLCHA
jgi:hypothetical protein